MRGTTKVRKLEKLELNYKHLGEAKNFSNSISSYGTYRKFTFCQRFSCVWLRNREERGWERWASYNMTRSVWYRSKWDGEKELPEKQQEFSLREHKSYTREPKKKPATLRLEKRQSRHKNRICAPRKNSLGRMIYDIELTWHPFFLFPWEEMFEQQ